MQNLTTGEKVAIGGVVVAAGVGVYYWLIKEGIIPPPEGEWLEAGEILARKDFSVSIGESDWLAAGVELDRKSFSVEIIEAENVPHIDSISPDPCWRGGTIIINGENFVGSYIWIHLSKAIVGYPEITVMPDTSTTTKLTLDLSRDTGPPAYRTIGDFLGPGRVMVEVMVIRDAEHLWTNEVGFDMT